MGMVKDYIQKRLDSCEAAKSVAWAAIRVAVHRENPTVLKNKMGELDYLKRRETVLETALSDAHRAEANLSVKLGSQEFNELCYAYRCAPQDNQEEVVKRFDAIVEWIKQEV